MPEDDDAATTDRRAGIRELVAVVVLSVTAVVIAWSGFESSKWGGEMSIAFSRASAARIEASRFAAEADAARGFDLDVFSVYVQAVAEGDDARADALFAEALENQRGDDEPPSAMGERLLSPWPQQTLTHRVIHRLRIPAFLHGFHRAGSHRAT